MREKKDLEKQIQIIKRISSCRKISLKMEIQL